MTLETLQQELLVAQDTIKQLQDDKKSYEIIREELEEKLKSQAVEMSNLIQHNNELFRRVAHQTIATNEVNETKQTETNEKSWKELAKEMYNLPENSPLLF